MHDADCLTHTQASLATIQVRYCHQCARHKLNGARLPPWCLSCSNQGTQGIDIGQVQGSPGPRPGRSPARCAPPPNCPCPHHWAAPPPCHAPAQSYGKVQPKAPLTNWPAFPNQGALAFEAVSLFIIRVQQLFMLWHLKRSSFLRSESYTGVSAMWMPFHLSSLLKPKPSRMHTWTSTTGNHGWERTRGRARHGGGACKRLHIVWRMASQPAEQHAAQTESCCVKVACGKRQPRPNSEGQPAMISTLRERCSSGAASISTVTVQSAFMQYANLHSARP